MLGVFTLHLWKMALSDISGMGGCGGLLESVRQYVQKLKRGVWRGF